MKTQAEYPKDKADLFRSFISVAVVILLGMGGWTLNLVVRMSQVLERHEANITNIQQQLNQEHQKNDDQDKELTDMSRQIFLRPEDLVIQDDKR